MKEVFKKVLGNYFNNTSNYKIVLAIFVAFVSAIFTILEPFFIKIIIESIEEYYKAGEYDFSSLFLVFIYWGIFILFTIMIRAFYLYFLVEKLNLNNYYLEMRNNVKKGIYMKYDDYLKRKSGELFKVFDRGVENIYQLIDFIFKDLLVNVFGIVFIFCVLFYVDWRMSIAIFAMVPFMIFMGIYFNKLTAQKQKDVNIIYEKSFGYYADSINNMGLLKILGLEKKMFGLIDSKINEALGKQLSVSKRWTIADIYINIGVMFSRFLVLFIGIYLLTKGELNLATLILFYTYVGYIYYPLNYIFYKLGYFQKLSVGISRFYEEFDKLNQDIDIENKKNLDKVNGIIEYKDVKFAYNNDKVVFEKLNFKINKSEKIALVGHTGAGKSTIVNLLFRFFDLNKGKILIDGNNINDISISSLRKHIGLVMQDSTLFNDTIRNNLLFARKDASDEELRKALKKASATFVLDLKDGLDTIIGERGLKLSGGEKQRLNIARIILKNPEILILDEATSSLDNKTEVEIQKSLEQLMEGKTTIIIAHRLSTIKKVDRIIYLENGEILEEGNYKYLMNKKGKFYELANPDNLEF